MQNNRRTINICFFSFIWLVTFVCAADGYSQKKAEKSSTVTESSRISSQIIKSSPAYAEVLLRKTERESELEEFLIGYTEEFPKVKEIRFELGLIQKETDKILAVNASDAGRLTLALGKLVIRKIELEVDLWNLRSQYKDDHIEVKRARRKLEIYEKAVREILP